MSGMGGHVSAFVVAVERKVETEEVLEVLVSPAFSEHGGKIVSPILVEVDFGGERSASAVGVLVDLSGDGGQFTEQGDAVVKSRLPVVGLVQAPFVELSELGRVAK